MRRAATNYRSRFLVVVPFAVIVFAVGGHADEPPSLLVRGRDGESVKLTVADLAKMPRVEVTAREKDGTFAKFSGVEVVSVLARVGVPQGDKLRGEWLQCHVLVSASDGYRVAYGIAEFDSSFTDQRIILAESRNGAPLDPKHGPWQIIVPHEKRQSRWIRMVTEMRVVPAQDTSDSAK